MKKLNVKRYLQDPSHCAVAAVASVANYYNENIDYKHVKKMAIDKKVVKNADVISESGLDDGEMGLLLNHLGFRKVTFITSELKGFDYTWAKYTKNKLLKTMKENRNKIDLDYRGDFKSLYKWYKKKDYDNNIVIDYNFGKYIRKYINANKPVLISMNWTQFFKFAKETDDKEDPVQGEPSLHEVVVYGYNKTKVYICDSHHEYYKYRLKRYRKGYYSVSWENLMTIMGNGYMLLAENYYEN